ncbi:MAG: sulfurtransferase complex subunit TusB [Rhodoferax sp.]|nr:sulfurtransferase complex subunit TusB [Rhodoferax sp.]
MLHIVNKSPFQTQSLETCLRFAQAGSAVLLIEDGIYAASTGSSTEARMREASATVKLYALKPDVDARAMGTRLIDGITLVDYAGFVDLTLEYPTVQSWL